MSVDSPYRTADRTIVNLCDRRRGFHFRAMFHITLQIIIISHGFLGTVAISCQVPITFSRKEMIKNAEMDNLQFEATQTVRDNRVHD